MEECFVRELIRYLCQGQTTNDRLATAHIHGRRWPSQPIVAYEHPTGEKPRSSSELFAVLGMEIAETKKIAT